ncbi:MAG: hypothetical protein V1899_02450 [Planctomycetota bacterium]
MNDEKRKNEKLKDFRECTKEFALRIIRAKGNVSLFIIHNSLFIIALMLLSAGIASSAWAMMEPIEGSPENVEWRVQLIAKEQTDQLRLQASIAQQQADAKKKVLEDRVRGFKNAVILKQAESKGNATTTDPNNEIATVVAVKWNTSEQNSSVVWLFVLGITTAFALLICAIMYEMRRLRKKRMQLEELRLRQLALPHIGATRQKS